MLTFAHAGFGHLPEITIITLSYVGRAGAGAVLLATGIIDNNAVAIVVAAMFLPFLAEVLAIGLGLCERDAPLLLRGFRALAVSPALAFCGGVITAAVQGGPILFTGFRGPLVSLAISAVIGITAGLSETDDTGRHYLIGVAAAVQLAIFPVWFGAALVLGLPSSDVLQSRLLSFLINLITIAIAAALAYAALHGRRQQFAASGNTGR
jgi:hypothetical protein